MAGGNASTSASEAAGNSAPADGGAAGAAGATLPGGEEVQFGTEIEEEADACFKVRLHSSPHPNPNPYANPSSPASQLHP